LLVVIVPLAALGLSAQKKAKFGMSLIPAGTFEMGQRAEDIPKLMEFFKVKHVEIFQEEVPQQRVKLSAFYWTNMK